MVTDPTDADRPELTVKGLSTHPVLAHIPDYMQMDPMRWEPFRQFDDDGRRIRNEKPILAGVAAAIHHAVVVQRSSTVIIPEIWLRQAVWGARTAPANWRAKVLEFLRTKLGRFVDSVEEVEQKSPEFECPECCFMNGDEGRHRHLRIKISVGFEGATPGRKNDTKSADVSAIQDKNGANAPNPSAESLPSSTMQLGVNGQGATLDGAVGSATGAVTVTAATSDSVVADARNRLAAAVRVIKESHRAYEGDVTGSDSLPVALTEPMPLVAIDSVDTWSSANVDPEVGLECDSDAECDRSECLSCAGNATNGVGSDSLLGGDGSDTIFGDVGDDTISGGDGVDTASGGDGNDSISGDAGNDSLVGDNDADTISGGTENDTIYGGGDAAADSLLGGNDADTISGGNDGDTVLGGTGTDTISGGNDADTIDGGNDNDTVFGGIGTDTISGNTGNDSLDGGVDGDTLFGDADNDTLYGGGDAGNDSLVGIGDSDTIEGVDGDDTLLVGADDPSILDATSIPAGAQIDYFYAFLGRMEAFGGPLEVLPRTYDWSQKGDVYDADSIAGAQSSPAERILEDLYYFKRGGAICAIYFPMLLFGMSPGVKLSRNQVQLHKSLTAELTRVSGERTRRPDKAELITTLSDIAAGCPYLEAGKRYVHFDGNGGRRNRRLHGRGYRIFIRMMRANYLPDVSDLPDEESPWSSDFYRECQLRYLEDLQYICTEYGCIAAGYHSRTREWVSLAEMIEMTRKGVKEKFLETCTIRIFTEEDFLIRWKLILGRQMGFVDPQTAATRTGEAPCTVTRQAFLAYMTKNKLKQKDVAAKMGVSQGSVSMHLHGKRKWSKTWREKLNRMLSKEQK